MNKLKLWDGHQTFEDAEKEWDLQSVLAEQKQPIKKLSSMPSMVGITPETAKNLKWKSLKWIVTEDHDRKILKSILNKCSGFVCLSGERLFLPDFILKKIFIYGK